MNIIDIIERKRDGGKLSRAEIEYFVGGVVDESIADSQVSALLMAIFIRGMDSDETFYLTSTMASSGEIINYNDYGMSDVLDKHSTGGVGDTVSLVLVPLLAAMGYKMSKMSGRGLGITGGTIDKLESIPGFNTSLHIDDFINQVKSVGCAIIGQTKNLTPADKRLYALRNDTATINSLPLIASSIMSKKIAGGATNIVIDVKYGSGAFMKTINDARALGDIMKDIGDKYKIKVDYVLSSMNAPLSLYIGNALEVYGAIETLKGEKNCLFDATCEIVTRLLADKAAADVVLAIDKAISSGAALAKFRDMVEAQSGDVRYIDSPELLLSANCRVQVNSVRNGYVMSIDMEKLAKAVFDMGGGRLRKEDKIDLSVGIKINKLVGEKVKVDESLAELYYNNYSDIVYMKKVLDAFEISR